MNPNQNTQTPPASIQTNKQLLRKCLIALVPLAVTLLCLLTTQLVTDHTCRNVPAESRGECIPGMWFFLAVIVLFFAFWGSIFYAVSTIFGAIQTARKRSKS